MRLFLLGQGFIPLGDAIFLSFEERVGRIEDFNLLNFVTLLDGIDDVLSLGDIAEDRMFPVKVWSRDVGDEELAPVRSWSGVCH